MKRELSQVPTTFTCLPHFQRSKAVRSEFPNEERVVSGANHVRVCLTFNDLKLYVVVSFS